MIGVCVWDVSPDYAHLFSTFNDAPFRSRSKLQQKAPDQVSGGGLKITGKRLKLHLRSFSLVLIKGSSPALCCSSIMKWPEEISQKTLNKLCLDSEPRNNRFLTIGNVWLKGQLILQLQKLFKAVAVYFKTRSALIMTIKLWLNPFSAILSLYRCQNCDFKGQILVSGNHFRKYVQCEKGKSCHHKKDVYFLNVQTGGAP